MPDCTHGARRRTECRIERVARRPHGAFGLPLYIDRESLPLLRLRYVGDYRDAELTEFLRKLEAVLELPGRKACLIDLSEATAGTATQRQMQASWISKHEKTLERDFAAAAI